MAYETKAILRAVGIIIRKAESLKEAYEAVAEIANAEGVVLEPFKINNQEIEQTEKPGQNDNEQ